MMILGVQQARRVLKRVLEGALERPEDPCALSDRPSLVFVTRTDVQNWAGSGVAGDLSWDEAGDLAHVVSDDAHKLGFRYGDDWAPMIDELSETEFSEYVDAALQSRKSDS